MHAMHVAQKEGLMNRLAIVWKATCNMKSDLTGYTIISSYPKERCTTPYRPLVLSAFFLEFISSKLLVITRQPCP